MSRIAGENVEKARKRTLDDRGRRLSQAGLARQLEREGVSLTAMSVSRIERGEQNVLPEVAVALAKVFKISVDDLYTPEDKRDTERARRAQQEREREIEDRQRWLADEIRSLCVAFGAVFESGRELRKLLQGDRRHPSTIASKLVADGIDGLRVDVDGVVHPLIRGLLKTTARELAWLGSDLAVAEGVPGSPPLDRDITPEQHAASERFNSREEQTRKDFGDAITEDEAEEAWRVEQERAIERDRRRDARRSGGER